MSNKVEKWSKWLDVIGVQIRNMLTKQDTHHTVLKIIAENKALHQNNPFYDHLLHTYMAYISVSLRRQLKRKDNSISLCGLLFDMSENKNDIPKYEKNNIFTHEYAFIDPGEDLEKIKKLSETIEEFVDRRIAHTDKRPLDRLPNPNEIEECISMMKDIHKKYYLVIKNFNIELMPAMYEWDQIFKIPWIQENEPNRAGRSMNEKQKKLVIGTGVILILMALFPPFIVTINGMTLNVGYSFILFQSQQVYQVHTSLLFIQWLFVISVSVIGWLLLKSKLD